ncbi:hypothetical protein [Acinetobacter sp. Ac_5812]|uniref:hypothetical protein n=1 Tax=Acinetobacter sp. Ac_5812 TaxID=1848937 RepID=UPI00148F8E9B|nr:hypothetical protein [Acinetobacter sp. Ac_5812]NNP70381.1 hypothetical protein [Acinetobacter sp. Ac_5812]
MDMGFKRAKILSYDSSNRTAKVHIPGLTDGSAEGLTATFAYPVGDSDKDTEREILDGEDVYIFFENNEQSRPVIAFYSSHGKDVVVDTRRIRQENIELLARTQVNIEAPEIRIKGKLVLEGDFEHLGNQETTGTISATEDVIAAGVSGKSHSHKGVRTGTDDSGPPIATGT